MVKYSEKIRQLNDELVPKIKKAKSEIECRSLFAKYYEKFSKIYEKAKLTREELKEKMVHTRNLIRLLKEKIK